VEHEGVHLLLQRLSADAALDNEPAQIVALVVETRALVQHRQGFVLVSALQQQGRQIAQAIGQDAFVLAHRRRDVARRRRDAAAAAAAAAASGSWRDAAHARQLEDRRVGAGQRRDRGRLQRGEAVGEPPPAHPKR
jgi:hypothetical protein